MAIAHFSKMFAVEDAKIAKLTADPAAGTATYATAIDVPGIKSVVLGGDIKSVELRGDNQLLDKNSLLQNVTATINFAKMDLDILAILMGGTVADSGTGSAEVAAYALTGASRFNYFKIEAKTPADGVDLIGGDAHLVIYKMMMSSFPGLGFAEEDYQTFSMQASATPRISDNKWLDLLLNETAAAIA